MSLARLAFSGVKWNAFAKIVTILFQLVSTVILARLIPVEDFGLFGMVVVFTGLARALSQFGLNAAIIQRREATEFQLSSLYWLNVGVGCCVALLLITVSPLIVLFFGQTKLYPILIWSAISFVILSFGQQFDSLLQKEMAFRRLAQISVMEIIIGGIASVLFAWSGAGALSLVWGGVTRSAVRSGCLLFDAFRRQWLPRLHFSVSELRGFIGFASYQLGEQMVNLIGNNIDYLVIGRVLGATQLGYYTLAFNLTNIPRYQLNPVITTVAFPLFSSVQHDDSKLRSGYQKTLSYVSLISFPLLIGLFAIAEPFIRIVYGEVWLPAVPALQAYCFLGIIYALGNPIGSIILAKGRADIGFWCNALAVLGFLVAVVVGVNWGILGVAISISFFNVVIMQPLDFYLLRLLINMTIREFYEAVRIPGIATGFMILVIFLIQGFWPVSDDLFTVIRAIISGGTVYSIAVWLLAQQMILDTYKMFRAQS